MNDDAKKLARQELIKLLHHASDLTCLLSTVERDQYDKCGDEIFKALAALNAEHVLYQKPAAPAQRTGTPLDTARPIPGLPSSRGRDPIV